ncbi:MAG: trypsin-like peptidase domain-containing protein [Magnetovibrio sp.]|nr:trypsin-like peptidase domain-containing protein [Magnetovibrio sp.]
MSTKPSMATSAQTTVAQASPELPTHSIATKKPGLNPEQRRLLELISADANAGQNSRIAVAEVTSKTMLRMGHIDFPMSIELDLPVQAERMSLNDILDPQADGPRFAFVFDVTMAKASRRVVNLKGEPSTVFLGYAGSPVSIAPSDPAANAASNQNLQSSNNMAQSYVGKSQALGAPLIFAYEYNKAQIDARRTMSVTTYVIDRVKRTYVKSNFDIEDQNRFEVVYGVSRHDPKRNNISAQFDTEQDIDDYEKNSLDIRLSALLKDYSNKRTTARNLGTGMALRKMLLKDRNTVLADVNANTFDDRPLNDPRFDTVVAVYTGDGSLGSGFYVTPNVVMTNWHVVKDHPFVEMKAYDGQETYGTVLGKDVLLDVALVRVERRGRPVAFYTGKNINLGATVEAIGHPHRFEFSITRGVISAVRKHHSINLPSGAGDKVLFIQTDAPVNPGNSGGPLFLGNRVIGMNTWGQNKSIAEGLNFSVHYSELMNFMNAHLPGYAVSPAGPKKEAKR